MIAHDTSNEDKRVYFKEENWSFMAEQTVHWWADYYTDHCILDTLLS